MFTSKRVGPFQIDPTCSDPTCKCWEHVRYCMCDSHAEPPSEPDTSGRVLLIVEKGSVVSKPSHVDLVEIATGSWPPIVVRNGDF